jgi:hypothetical protein
MAGRGEEMLYPRKMKGIVKEYERMREKDKR